MTVYTFCCHSTTYPACQYVEFDTEEEFWSDFRNSQKTYADRGEPGVLLALVPKAEADSQAPITDGVPDKL